MEAKANELRINNLLRDKISKTLLKVIELNEKGIITYVIDRSKFPLQKGWGLEPIPLTEEILLKCPQFKHNPIVKVATVFNMDLGRDRELTVSCVGTPNLAIFITNKENGKTTDIVTIWNYDYDKELYLHTFQNLIHSLTNEELTVNL